MLHKQVSHIGNFSTTVNYIDADMIELKDLTFSSTTLSLSEMGAILGSSVASSMQHEQMTGPTWLHYPCD